MEKDIVLSKRMEAVVNMVSPQSLVVPKAVYVADVGCDHAYVSIALVKRRIADKVIALDVRKGPLEIAAKNIAQYGVLNAIELRLSDGMDQLAAGEVNVIIMAGMGGLLMCSILERGLNRLSGDGLWQTKQQTPADDRRRPVLVLQPQSDLFRVRSLLLEYGYCMEREKMLVDEGKYYTVIRAVPEELLDCKGKEKLQAGKPYTETELWYGRYGLQHQDMALYDFLQKEAAVLEEIYQRLGDTVEKAHKEGLEVPQKTSERFQSIQKERERNRQAAGYFLR
ncbi:MAG: class I SAM-dependent methyltransferase [Clostridium sp.]|nr:class I SAM-dependent methyltransferase [Clostridium sp.]